MGITSPIFSMFGPSPIKPLEQHIDITYAAAKRLIPFMQEVFKQNWAQAEILQQEISKKERDADQLKSDLRIHLPKGLFLPVPRSDILELLTTQDRIANIAKDIAGTMIGRRMEIPEAIVKDFLDYLQCSVDACAQARKAINELDELLETGFRGNEVTLVEEMIHKLDLIEHASDDKQITIRQQLLEIETQLPPIDAFFLYRAIELIGDLADSAQAVGGRLQILLAR